MILQSQLLKLSRNLFLLGVKSEIYDAKDGSGYSTYRGGFVTAQQRVEVLIRRCIPYIEQPIHHFECKHLVKDRHENC